MADFESPFVITEHITSCQHIRGYAHGSRNPNAALRLAVKQYVPKFPLSSTNTAVTIIATHANGLPKETYEPLWDDLNAQLEGNIRSIWIADCSHQGESGVLNEHIQGDDPNWFDHSRDLLSMVNCFRELIVPPIIGVAHSMGCAQLVQLSLMHPRLFQSLVLMEPVIQETIPPGPNASHMTSFRPDRWKSAEDARAFFMDHKFYKSWDKRVLDKYLQYGLRTTPTAIYPDESSGTLTLKTSKAQEAWSYVRSTFSARPPEEALDDKERMITADYTPAQAKYIFHRAEAGIAFQGLSQLQPAVMWVFGDRSYINRAADREVKVRRTGTAVRGSGKVSSTIIEGAGHQVPQEKVLETAQVLALHVQEQMQKFSEQQAFLTAYDSEKSEDEMRKLSKKWLKSVQQRSDVLRPTEEKAKL